MVTIYYRSSWNPCYIHAPVGGHWSSHPMSAHPERRKWLTITIEDIKEFVFTNGNEKWDNPSPGQNYKITGPGAYAVFHGKIIEIKPAKRPVLLISDLDNTLIGNYQPTIEALARFNDYWIQSHYFTGSKLVYNTGRSLEEFLALYEEGYQILDPDLLVTAVGSTVYTLNFDTGAYELRTDYYDLFNQDHWDSHIVDRMVQQEFPWLILPDNCHIYPFKIWFTAKTKDVNKYLKDLKVFLRNPENIVTNGKIIKAKTIVSGRYDMRYIDITPLEGGKGLGVTYAKRLFGFDDKDTIAVGDSGNDIGMMKGDHWSIIVANYEDDLIEWLRKKERKNILIAEHMFGDAVQECIEKIHNTY
ncbi:unnamed protein product [Blepharisma stoltei]|uniref:Sucrose phosphatase-like domain-containing protein n=1 Tax=Blepharisma stoltei TaxID=1481888 RepID=A0AAU9K945_9CILI|nr:unnamed protein product [Blepharisma stoltei]